MIKLQNKLKGFTLLELVIVIAIIGILAVIVLPNFIQALAKARDAKKMTELRGVQTFLTTTGIDTSLRYPMNQAALLEWFAGTRNRVPQGLTGAAPAYNYAGIGCNADVVVTVGGVQYGNGIAVANRTQTCNSYQLWTELEADNAALRLDADLVGIASGAACNAATGTCIPIGDIVAGLATLAAQAGVANNLTQTNTGGGAMETCTVAAAADCIFDLVP